MAPMPDSSRSVVAVLIEEPGQFTLEPPDLGERLTVTGDEGAQP